MRRPTTRSKRKGFLAPSAVWTASIGFKSKPRYGGFQE
jgi:hypothetical protein